ncbi:MAG: hypothetical protein ACRCYP_01705 [Alphaproteobacteria bacterium]
MDKIQFSPTIGGAPKVAKFIPQSIFWTGSFWAIALITISSTLAPFDLLKDEDWILIFFACCGVDMLLRGDRPWKFDGKFWGLLPDGLLGGKRLSRANVHFEPTMAQPTVSRIKPKKVQGKITHAVENEFDILHYVDFQEGNNSIGGRVLRKGDFYQVNFTWEVQPYPSSITLTEGKKVIDRIRTGLRGLNENEALSFRAGVYRESVPKPQRCKKRVIQALLAQDQQHDRLQRQAALGRRAVKRIYITATYTVTSRGVKAEDPIEYWLDQARGLLADVSQQKNYNSLPVIVSGAYEAWRSLDRLITRSLGLVASPLSLDDIWQHDYHLFNKGYVPKIPYYLISDHGKVRLQINQKKHLKSVLFKGGAPKTYVKPHTYLPGKELFVGTAILSDKPLVNFKSDSSEDALRQLFFGSALLNDSPGPGKAVAASEIWDTEFIVEFTGENQGEIRNKASKLEDENNAARKLARSSGDTNALTEHKLEKTGGDRIKIFEGAQTIKATVIALVYRKHPKTLRRAINALCELEQTKGYFEPEREYSPALWRTTLPIELKSAGKGPAMWWDRRVSDFTEAAASFVPIVSDWTEAKEGIEFQSEYGNSPFWVNPFPDQGVNAKIRLGTKGSGKSVLETGDLLCAYQKGIPAFVLDATQGQIATFAPVCDALGGGYFNSREDSFNMLQGADLRKFENDPEKYQYAVDLLRDQWSQTITDLIIGPRSDEALREDYLSITTSFFRQWFNDPLIRTSYDRAFDGGFGSSDWKAIPTLKTYLEFAQFNRLREIILASNTDLQDAKSVLDRYENLLLNYRAELSLFLQRPTGERISTPSTFDTNKPIVVCALGNINDMREVDVLPLIASVLGLTTSAALTYPKVSITGDEASTCCKYRCYATAFGGYYSGGRKQGIYPRLIGQDLASLQRGENSSRYLENTDTWEIGRVTTAAANYLSSPESGIGMDRNILHLVDENAPRPKRDEAYSRWAIKTEGKTLVGRYCPSFFQLAISANSPEEFADRQRFLDKYPNDTLKGYMAYSKYLEAKTIDSKVSLEEFAA